MKDHALAMLNGKVTTTMTVLTQLMRLHQITCGHLLPMMVQYNQLKVIE